MLTFIIFYVALSGLDVPIGFDFQGLAALATRFRPYGATGSLAGATRALLIAPLSAVSALATSTSPRQNTYCNPVNIDYAYCPTPQFVEQGNRRLTDSASGMPVFDMLS